MTKIQLQTQVKPSNLVKPRKVTQPKILYYNRIEINLTKQTVYLPLPLQYWHSLFPLTSKIYLSRPDLSADRIVAVIMNLSPLFKYNTER